MKKSSKQSVLDKTDDFNFSPQLKVGRYFRLYEFVNSSVAKQAGIDNSIPSPLVLSHIEDLCANILDPIRSKLGSPLIISSGYRCVALNRLVRGSVSSYHLAGRAADITAGDFKALVDVVSGLVSDGTISPTEIIYHNTYIHIAL